MEDIDVEKIKEIKCIIRNVIHKGLGIDEEDFKEYVDKLLEYTDAMEKQMGIEKAISGMRQNNVNNLMNKLEQKETRIKQLENELNLTKIKELQNEERSLDLEITNKKYQIEKYSKAIDEIEEIIIELNDNLNIIY